MVNYHRVTKNERALEETLNVEKSLRVRVLAKNGQVIGRAHEIRLHPTKMTVEGVLIKRGLFKRPIYIGSTYIDRLSHDAFILGVNPTVLLKGKPVMTDEGKRIGTVKEVIRKEHSNELHGIIVTSRFRKPVKILMNGIQRIGDSVILKANYHVKRTFIWKKDA